MRYVLGFIILIHGLIHFMGFAKAFGYGNITQISKNISKPVGAVWLLAALLFITAVILLFQKSDLWMWLALIAAVLSQALIITVWNDAKFGSIANFIILVVIVAAFCGYSVIKHQ
ncbi:MAG: hypothetical protein AB7P01_10890 [Bacteroidia bacterium]